MEYISIIGLEIHCELNTESKMFCACPNNPEDKSPNTNVCPVCLGHPGTLPVPNSEAIRKVRLVGLALDSKILEYCKFDRKNYFYPDLPKGYQISQYDLPLCLGGALEIDNGDAKKIINITRVHLEEDTGKLMHDDIGGGSLVDFNRGGVPLMELVTEPDMENARQVRQFVEELQLILRTLDVSDADMEKGKLRVEVNISLSPKIENNGKKVLGTKVEIKNLNSLKAVEGSVAFEIARQSEILERGEKVIQETRGWNEAKGITFSQREKEEAFDYRYFPEPDIPPMVINADEIKSLKCQIGELPAKKRKRYAAQYGLDAPTIEFFVRNEDLGNFFERTMSEMEEWVNVDEGDNSNTVTQEASMAKLCANYLTTDVTGLLKGQVFCHDSFRADADHFAEFIELIYKKEISSKIAKIVLAEMAERGGQPTEIIAQKGLSQISDEGQIVKIINEVLAKNQKAAADYKNGKQGVFQFLVGNVLAQTHGRANPDIVKKILLEELSKEG